MKIPDDHVENVCRRGQGSETCAFLGFGGEWMCMKEDRGLYQVVINRLREGSIRARGNNCSGAPEFSTVDESDDEA